MKKLYRAIYTTSLYFVSEEYNRVSQAQDAIEQDFKCNGLQGSTVISQVVNTTELGADAGACPFFAEGFKTCADYLNSPCDGKVVEIDGKKYKLTAI